MQQYTHKCSRKSIYENVNGEWSVVSCCALKHIDRSPFTKTFMRWLVTITTYLLIKKDAASNQEKET
jgi:hypothetical protein